jgi:DNA segregation ATPase FtsK/SpoIIIE, S-DNA-T family
MLDRQRLLRHGRALALLFAWAFLALSLVGYDPADPPGNAVEPPNAPPTNPCGPVGAALAHATFQAVGWASSLLLLAFGVAVLLAFRRRAVPDKGACALGLALLVAVAATLVQTVAPGLERSPPVGGGGYVGAVAAAFLWLQFGAAGMALILLAAGLVGLALCRDVLFVWPIQELLGALRRREPRPWSAAELPVPIDGPRAVAPAALGRDEPRAAPALGRPADAPAAQPPALIPGIGRGTRAAAPAPVVAAAGDGKYQLPPASLLEPPAPFPIHEHEAKIHERALLLEKTLREHGCIVRVVQIDTGPVITQFEIELEPGLRVARIVSLSNDLAIALAVPSVRIVSPIPGKTTVGIEVPNERRGIVRLGEVIAGLGAHVGKMRVPLFLGKDVKGMPLAFDLADMPHLLIAGRTGTGKSVCLNAMILSILMTRRPDEVKLLLIDPKMVELSQFKRIPHLMHPVVTDMKKAESILSWACDKMDERYGYLARAGVRNLQAYNALGAEEIYARLQPESDEERARIPTYMPSIVIIADEMADLMMTSAKEVEAHIVRLAQKARAVGMHLIVATQKPTVDVITGLIKGNLPARISFQVASRGDSRVVLDEMGADKLLGNGDMLFLIPGTSHIVRAQGTYVSDGEVNRICEFLEQYPVEFSKELIGLPLGGGSGKDRAEGLKERDELYEAAIEIIIQAGRGSTSLLQRALGIGYGRAARLIDFMAEDGIVGEFKSGSAREVLYSWDEWEALKNGSEPSGSAA